MARDREFEYSTPMEKRMVERIVDAEANKRVLISLTHIVILFILFLKFEYYILVRNWLMLLLIFALTISTGYALLLGLIAVNMRIQDVILIEDGIVVPKNKKRAKSFINKIGRAPVKYVQITRSDNKRVKYKCSNILGYKLLRGNKVRLVWFKSCHLPFVIPDMR